MDCSLISDSFSESMIDMVVVGHFAVAVFVSKLLDSEMEERTRLDKR